MPKKTDYSVSLREGGALGLVNGALGWGRWGGNVSLPVPAAKLSEAEEEQEDPYLNDRCRGEAVPPGVWPAMRRRQCCLLRSLTAGGAQVRLELPAGWESTGSLASAWLLYFLPPR